MTFHSIIILGSLFYKRVGILYRNRIEHIYQQSLLAHMTVYRKRVWSCSVYNSNSVLLRPYMEGSRHEGKCCCAHETPSCYHCSVVFIQPSYMQHLFEQCQIFVKRGATINECLRFLLRLFCLGSVFIQVTMEGCIIYSER